MKKTIKTIILLQSEFQVLLFSPLFILAVLIAINNFLNVLVISFDPFLLCALIPIKIYSNSDTCKVQILEENKNKSGIYM
jgi:hypothetical protein